VTFSETGGAGEVARLLATFQRGIGIDAKLVNLISEDLMSEPLAQPRITVAAAVDEYLVSNHSSPTILSLYRSRLSELNSNLLRKDSIIHLHWLPGVLSHQKVRDLLDQGRRVIWTLHDMAPFTGVCHHAHGCEGFHGNCNGCPQVRSLFRGEVEQNLSKKLFERPEPNLILVSPTQWLASQARASTVFKNQRIEVVENPVRPEFFEAGKQNKVMPPKGNAGVGQNEMLRITAVASDLTSPAKGIADLVKIVTRFRDEKVPIRLGLVGKRGAVFHNSEKGIYWLGSVSAAGMVRIAGDTDLLVSASSAESAGLIVREFGALGVPTLALASGGIADLIKNRISGLTVSSLKEMTERLLEIAKDPSIAVTLGKEAESLSIRNSPEKIANEYSALYS